MGEQKFPFLSVSSSQRSCRGKIGQRKCRDPFERPREKQVTRLKGCYVMEFLRMTGEFGGFDAIPGDSSWMWLSHGGLFVERLLTWKESKNPKCFLWLNKACSPGEAAQTCSSCVLKAFNPGNSALKEVWELVPK